MSAYREDLLSARFASLAPEPFEGDWLDVQRRARRPGRRRTLTVLIAAALAAVLVSSALALGPRVVDIFGVMDFFSAEPAPETVVNQFSELRRAAQLDWGQNLPVAESEARVILDRRVPGGGTVFLAVAPQLAGGGFCYAIRAFGTDGAGEDGVGCSDAKELERDPIRTGGVSTGDFEDPLGWHDFAGWVAEPGTDHLVIRYEDGSSDDVPLLWVSAPIDAGFFAFNPAAEHLRRGHRAIAVVAVDADDRELARVNFSYPDPNAEPDPWTIPRFSNLRWPPAVDQSTIRPLAIPGLPSWVEKVEIARGDGGYCYSMQFAQPSDFFMGPGCVTPKIPVTCCAIGYWGVTGERIGGKRTWGIGFIGVTPVGARVRLRFENGDREFVEPVERVVVYLVPRDRYAKGRRLVEAAVVGRNGAVVQRLEFDPRYEIWYRHPPTP